MRGGEDPRSWKDADLLAWLSLASQSYRISWRNVRKRINVIIIIETRGSSKELVKEKHVPLPTNTLTRCPTNIPTARVTCFCPIFNSISPSRQSALQLPRFAARNTSLRSFTHSPSFVVTKILFKPFTCSVSFILSIVCSTEG